MGEVVELWSIGTFRAQFLVKEWQHLVERFNGNHDKATRAHLSLCRDWERIWDVDASMDSDAEERRLGRLDDEELLREWRAAELNCPLLYLIAGELERRNLDESEAAGQPPRNARSAPALKAHNDDKGPK